MSIPHSKLLQKTKAKPLSASKSIMAMASIQRDIRRSRLTNEQSQTVNINLSHPTMTRDIQPQLTPQDVQYPTPYEVAEGITVVPPTTNIPQDTKPTPTQVQDASSDAYSYSHTPLPSGQASPPCASIRHVRHSLMTRYA